MPTTNNIQPVADTPDTASPSPDPQPSLMSAYISRGDLASDLGVGTETMSRWASARTGPPFIRIGGRVMYRRQAVADWLVAREQGIPADLAAKRRGRS